MLFMGEEWGASTPWQYFTDHAEPELAEAIRQGRRREFAEYGWDAEEIPDPQADSTRDASVLRWDETDQEPHARLLRWYRAVVALRRAEPDLRDGRLDRVDVAFGGSERGDEAGPDGWFVLARGGFRVVCALGADAVTVPLDVPASSVVQAWDGAEVVDGGVRLPGRSVAVVAVGG
jgi:maltooligosyltrehalose trehalohydrolase